MSQSFGTKNKKMVGVYMQKGLIIYTLYMVIGIAIMINTETLLLLTGQDREISHLAGQYTTILSFGIIGMGIWNLLSRFFRIQNIIWIGCVTIGINAAVSAVAHYIFMDIWGFGIEGSAYAQVLGFTSAGVGMAILMPLQGKTLAATWGGFTRDAWQDWQTFSSLSFAGLLVVCLQWWGIEICTILSGTLGKVELAAQAITFQINYFLYLIPVSVGISCNILIGQYVGGGEPELAKLSMRIGWTLSLIMSSTAIIVLLALRFEIPKLFSQDTDVLNLTSGTMPYLALYHIFDSIVTSSLGMCRGVAKQKMGSCVSFFGVYCIGLPIAIYLTFYQYIGIRGIWLGLACGLAVEVCIFIVLLVRTNWQKECEAAQIRAGIDPTTRAQCDINLLQVNTNDVESMIVLTDNHQSPSFKKRFGPEYASSQTDISVLKTVRNSRFTTRQLLLYRGLVITPCLLFLIGCVVLHFQFRFPYDWVELCIPVDKNRTEFSTGENRTLSFC